MQELSIVLNKISAQFNKRLPFVLYCKPGQTRITALLQKDDALHVVSNYIEKGFVFAPFDAGETLLIPENASDVMVLDFDARKGQSVINAILEENAGDRAAFEILINKAIAEINKGQFRKVVLSRKELVSLQQLDFSEIFRRILTEYPLAFRYCFFHPAAGLWIGATPERLLRLQGNAFSTVALAGTQKFHGSEAVVWQEKEIQEQEFVTDYITENLKSLGIQLKVSAPQTQKAGNLLHIKTQIEGVTDIKIGVGDIIKLLHPTPAVCGFPKESAKTFIIENEGYCREYYSGFLGELNLDFDVESSTDLYVNLRCMKVVDQEAQLFVGCGITKDSDPELEFLETVNKSITMKHVL